MRGFIGSVVAGAVLVFSSGVVSAQTGIPIKIGSLAPLTGPIAGPGAAMKAGVEIAFEEAGHRVAGRQIVVLHEDYAFKPDVAMTKVRKLVEGDKVDILIGPSGTHACLAMRNYLAEKGTPWIATQCAGKELSPPAKVAQNLFRVSFQYDQHHPIMARYVFEKLKYRKIVAFGLDYAAGHDETRAFTDAFKKVGGEVESVMIPLGTMDLSPYMAKISSNKIDAVFVNLWGVDATRFIKTAAEYGLTQRIPFFANGTATEEADTLPPAGDAAIGLLNYRTYSAQYNTPLNKAFVSRVQAKTGSLANQYVYSGYLAGRAALKALEATGGRTDDKAALLTALRKAQFEAPGGDFRFDPNQQAVMSLFIRKVVKRDGKVVNELVDTIANISPAP